MAGLPRGKPFAKGTSGNPSGRPKVVGEIQELARKHAPEAIQALVDIAMRGESESARVAAASALLDRGYGRPSQQMDIEIVKTTVARVPAVSENADAWRAQHVPETMKNLQ